MLDTVLWIRITNADPDSTYHSDSDPDSDFYLMQFFLLKIFLATHKTIQLNTLEAGITSSNA